MIIDNLGIGSHQSYESSYAKWDGGKFRRVSEPEKSLPYSAENAYEDFRAYIIDDKFSCIGAKAALNGNLFRVGCYDEINTFETNRLLSHDLGVFAAEQKESATNYASFAAIFTGSKFENENVWERSLWAQLESLHELDRQKFEWDPSVSSDPENPGFSFSFAGTGFFIVGLHPQSSRVARRFSRAAMVFNPHAQFDRLRELDQYERMQQTIRTRELKLQGSLNPNLSDYGTQSEARQYSGRAVEENWKCPFSGHTKTAGNADI
ncbi:MAG: guanitoxin biosynthesis heme-dependent pre-guanitoxin N-hydroxylase GntA [Pyrinomonadaceae bacterium]